MGERKGSKENERWELSRTTKNPVEQLKDGQIKDTAKEEERKTHKERKR